jgi:hypothetical protein
MVAAGQRREREQRRGEHPLARIDAGAPDPSAAPHYVDLTDTPELDALASTLWALGILPDNDPACSDLGLGPRFCPDEPAQRIDAAVWMVRAFGE